jgi:hypothetical protein
MMELSDLGDYVGDFLPRAIGLALTLRGGDRDATGSSLGDAYTVVLSPELHESFFARFEHLLEWRDLGGMPLFSPAAAASNLSLEQYRRHVVLRTCAILARDPTLGCGLERWTPVVREIAGRLRKDRSPFRPRVRAARRHLGDLRRRALGCADFSPELATRLRRYRPFILIGNQVLIEMCPQWDFRRPAANQDVADVTLLSEPWFGRIVTTVHLELADERDPVEKAEDEKFCVDLAAARSPIRGAGELQAFAVSAPAPDWLKVAMDTGGPFFMEFAPGQVVLWPAAVVSVEAETSALFGPRTDLVVRLSSGAGGRGRAPGSRSAEASSLAHLASHLSLHPFVSREMTLCVGNTSQRNRHFAQHASLADVVLEAHLRGAVRVFRYGWRRSNQNRVYHDLRADPLPPGLNVIPLAEALKYVAAHPEVELVRWQP